MASPIADLGRLLLLVGGILVVAGVALILLGRTQIPVGRLPGDIVYRGKNTTVYFPIVTCILLSVILSAVFYLISRLRH